MDALVRTGRKPPTIDSALPPLAVPVKVAAQLIGVGRSTLWCSSDRKRSRQSASAASGSYSTRRFKLSSKAGEQKKRHSLAIEEPRRHAVSDTNFNFSALLFRLASEPSYRRAWHTRLGDVLV
jgi:hypothetical protein